MQFLPSARSTLPQPLMPAAAAPAPLFAGEPDLAAARAQVEALDALLEDEFQALREQRFERLEQMQTDKVALLESLQLTANHVASLSERPALWAGITEALAASRESFRRNERLVTRQMVVVRDALRALQAADPTASVDLYDRLGQMSRRGGRRLYSEA
jgi:flagellar biosynthesis/type III secretory pathway chaperone